MMPPSSESDVMNAITDFLTMKKVYFLRLNSGAVLQQRGPVRYKINLCPEGTPDIFCIIGGRPCFFEVKKSEKEKETWNKKVNKWRKTGFIPVSSKREVNQAKTIERIGVEGGYATVVGGIDDFVKAYNVLTYAITGEK